MCSMKQSVKAQRTDKNSTITYAGYRFPPELISYAVWLYFRFPLSLRMVEEMLAARGIEVTYETVRRWALKFGQKVARRIRARRSTFGDKWHLDCWCQWNLDSAGVRMQSAPTDQWQA